MRRGLCLFLIGMLLSTLGAFAQSDRGTITGTVADSSGAVLPGVGVVAVNSQTGTRYETVVTETGNYALNQLPAGEYEIAAELPGFRKYIRRGITVLVGQTLRIDIGLEVGSTSEAISVTADAPLLKTESGELSHNISTDQLNEIPILPIGGGGSAGTRNPLSATRLAPGTNFSSNLVLRVNGAPTNTQAVRIDGQDATNGYVPFATTQTQMSVDAVQEVSIQTSNFSAEFGQVGGGLLNFTMRSGTNRFRGSAYDYFANEALNAGLAWSDNGSGQHIRLLQRRNNYGGTFGGPIKLGKLYDGANKSFFFFNFEQFYENTVISNRFLTVPTSAFRNGDFSSVLTGRVLGTDPLGRPIMENAIYDPSTQRTAPNGQTVRDPFPNNRIPLDRMDPIALKIQSLIPAAANSNAVVNNLVLPWANPRYNTIPSIKLDHSLNAKTKFSFFYSSTKTSSDKQTTNNNEGYPDTITAGRTNTVKSRTWRLNLDQTLSPTLLFHLGAGYQTYLFEAIELAPYDAAKELGLKGVPYNRLFPSLTGLSTTVGGAEDMGTGSSSVNRFLKPSATASLSWVRNNHSYRFGGEFRAEGYFRETYSATAGAYAFSRSQTSLPSTSGQNLGGGAVGFPYASFLLGLVNSVTAAQPAFPRVGRHMLGVYAQDTWKVTRTLTLDYGLRYDYQSYLKEQYGRAASFSATTPNPTFGNMLGAPAFEGKGPGRCNCEFAKNYPYAFSPRLGFAYQLTPNTVLRGGIGVVYSATNMGGVGTALGLADSSVTLAAGTAGVDLPVTTLSLGNPLNPVWPSYDPGTFPAGSALVSIDQNAGRPARQVMWSLGLQRQLTRNLLVEAAYVANRGVWWQANGLNNINGLTNERLKSFGLDIANAADRTLLTSAVNSTIAANRGFNKVPFPGFIPTQTVAQSLRPFPQYGAINSLWSPLGNTWYDSLQTKVTKRLSAGLDVIQVFTWSKQLTLGAECEACGPVATENITAAVTDRSRRDVNKQLSGFDQPLIATFAVNYTIPRLRAAGIMSSILGNWQIGVVATYASGRPIRVPLSQNRLGTQLLGATSNATRIPGVPLFTNDLNCHCFDPGKTFVLNKDAWADPPAGQFGTAASYYSDYRYQRQPQESASLARLFRLKEGLSLQIRAEFTNIFNRLRVPNPTATNALATPLFDPNGYTLSGFGRIDTLSPAGGPRTGTILARLRF